MTELSAWLVLALVLVGLELVSGTFYLLAIAGGFLAGAFAAWLKVPLAGQIVLAALCALAAVALLRRWKRRQPHLTRTEPAYDVGQRVEVETWKDDTHVRVRYRGSHWDGELAATAEPRPAVLYIVALRGTTLQLSPIPPAH
ncbi:NfeD family protein [Chitinolyticbacter meiyuanensis]|uniref:NfeD family protein n=1 Tax=Chitinolyticbacter meiyuanensis TaxID=682798 RepID=UPI0011E5D6BA|nr:NfeD family protein [Chitinolyticbacter meiyuanensis]